jgi:hypothetical protein
VICHAQQKLGEKQGVDQHTFVAVIRNGKHVIDALNCAPTLKRPSRLAQRRLFFWRGRGAANGKRHC